jgi:hypothetical protein
MPVTLRPVGAADEPFLFDVYASTNVGELTPLGWSTDLRARLLRWQFNAQLRRDQHGLYDEAVVNRRREEGQV